METKPDRVLHKKTCAWCNHVFHTESPGAVYCKRTHKDAARKHRNKSKNVSCKSKKTSPSVPPVPIPEEITVSLVPSLKELRATKKGLETVNGRKAGQPHRREQISYYVKKDAAAARASRLNASAVCPQPTKRGFTFPHLAWDWIDYNHKDDNKIYPYQCRCGTIHIGHGSGYEAIARDDIHARTCLRCDSVFYASSHDEDYCKRHRRP